MHLQRDCIKREWIYSFELIKRNYKFISTKINSISKLMVVTWFEITDHIT